MTKERKPKSHRPNRKPETINTEGLRPTPAPDAPGETVVLTGRVEPELRDWLKTLPDGVSYHIRQAVRDYREKLLGASKNS